MSKGYTDKQLNAATINYGGNKQIKHIYNFFYDNSTVYLKRKYERFIAVYGQNS